MIHDDTRSTIFLFASPQYMAANPKLIEALLRAYKRNVLRAVGIDEAHLFVGQSHFRLCIRMLKDVLWKHIFDPSEPEMHPAFYAMTATMTLEYILLLEELTTLSFPP